VLSMSEMFNAQLLKNTDDSKARSFYQLFRDIDIDGSKRIAFPELERMVRSKLKLSERKLPRERLAGLWNALDQDASGFVDPGELSRFLRIGAPKTLTAVQAARARLQAEREARMARIRADTDKVLARDVQWIAADMRKATDEEVGHFGELFVTQLAAMRDRGKDNLSYYGLFKKMDVDESGRVKFEEFESMIREGLKLDEERLTKPAVWGLWKAIDENANGFICAGEFGRFMRKAAEGPNADVTPEMTVNAAANSKVLKEHQFAVLKQEETWARQKASAASTSAAQMEAEAKRLEALLASVQTQGLQTRSSEAARLMGSRSSVSLARAGGRADVGEAPAVEPDEPPSGPSSPVKRMEAIRLLTREVKAGGSRSRSNVHATLSGSSSTPMILPSLAREEGLP